MLEIDVKRTGDDCPFLNERIAFELGPGECLGILDVSGVGKLLPAYHGASTKRNPSGLVLWSAIILECPGQFKIVG